MSVLATRLKELRQKRKDACDKSGAIVSKAATEKRGLNTEERAQVETLHKEDMDLRGECETIETQLDAERALIDGELRRRDAGRENQKPGNEDRDAQWGEFRELKPEQRKHKYNDIARRWLLPADFGGGLTQEDRSYIDYCKRERLMVGWSDAGNAEQPELRALAGQLGSGGGFTIPQDFERSLEIALKAFGGMIGVADVVTTDNGALLPWPSVNDTTQTGENLAENATVSGTADNTGDPAFGVINLSAYLRDSKIVLLPITLIQDSAFDLEATLNPLLQIRLGRRLNTDFTTGTGNQGPTGIVTTVFAGTSVITTASATAFTYGEMLKTEHTVDPMYRANGKWMFHDTCLLALKLMVDGNGRPLFRASGVAEGIQGRAPDTVDGYPIVINQDMATLTAGVPAASQKTMLFGDLKKYKVRQVRGYQMVRFQERYMDKLQIGLMVYTRVDGALLDAGTHPVAGLLQHA